MTDDSKRVGPGRLLARAAELYDSPDSPLAKMAPWAGLRGFASGAEWMHLALAVLRGEPNAPSSLLPASRFHFLGLAKYGLASGVALGWAVAALWIEGPLLGLLAVPLFYAVEAQSVFLFPLALDGHDRPFREARRWTVLAGGTFPVMAIVMPIAATMLAGGLVGRGFVRSWCLGCLAICLWYEQLRLLAPSGAPAGEIDAVL
jgi:hypothetical protein